MSTTRLSVVIVAVLSVVALAGCGADPEQAGADLAEDVVEQDGGDDTEVDESDDGDDAPQEDDAATEIAASCGGDEAEWRALITEAQEEGTVTMAGPPNPEVSAAMPAAFRDAFGITVEYTAGSSGETAQKIASEREAGIHSLDIFLAGGNTMANVIYGGGWLADLRSELVSPDVDDPENWRGEDPSRPFVDEPDFNSVATVSVQGQAQFIVNTDLVADDEITGWNDLLDPKWQGSIVAMDPTRGAGLGFNVAVMLSNEYGRDFVRDLYVGQDVILQTDDRQAADSVARGRYAVAIGVSEANGGLAQLIEDGLPIRVMAAPDDGPSMVSAGYGLLGLMEPAANPAAAKLFANWIMCPSGNEAWNAANGYESARTDVEIDVPDYIRADTDSPYWNTYGWELLTSDATDEVLDNLNEDL